MGALTIPGSARSGPAAAARRLAAMVWASPP